MDRRATNLPLQMTTFVGRESDLARLHAELAAARLVTLAGPAGCGKTRLAIEAAAALLPSFRDGVRFVDFAPVIDPALVVHAVAESLGVQEHPGAPLLSTVVETLSARTLLLLLDNCEHLIGPSAELVLQLLSHCPAVTVVATSREPLRLPGETVMRIQPLSRPDGTGPLVPVDRLMSYDAVRLFVDRARAVAPDFALTERIAPAVARICRQLDGLPLALELAAAWAGTLHVEQIAARLDDRFRLLAEGRRTALPRHRTLRAAVAWSYDLLNEPEQRLFSRLSVFVDGCTLDAIEAVVAGDGLDAADVFPCLYRLVDASLLAADVHAQQPRYRLLETLRLYARERLVLSGEADRLQERHALYFLTFAEEAEPGLWGPDLAAWLNRLETEHENLRAALRWAVGRGEAAVAQRLGAALCRFWRVRGHASEGLRWLEGALAWRAETPPPVRARALDAAGHLARDRGDYAAADSYYRQSLQIWRDLDNLRGVALTTNTLGMVARFRDDAPSAIALQEESVRLFRAMADERGIALSLVTLAATVQWAGDRPGAAALYADALAAFRMLGDVRGTAATLNNLGNLASEGDEPASAVRFYDESLALFRELGDRYEEAACLRNLAGVAHALGDEERALAASRESLRLFAEAGDHRGTTGALLFLARLAAAKGALDRAAWFLGLAETLSASGDFGARPAALEIETTLGQLASAFDDERIAAARAAGRLGSVEEAVTLDLAGAELSEAGAATRARSGELTRRQREVAQLIAEGLTNRQIADSLFIAERTADTHVEHILARLGFESRAQIASWVARQG